jgi:hypothetical protein
MLLALVMGCEYAKTYGRCVISHVFMNRNSTASIQFDFVSDNPIAEDFDQTFRFFGYRAPSGQTVLRHSIAENSELSCIRWLCLEDGP